MKNKLTFLLALIPMLVFSQIGIGTTSPDTSSILEVNSPNNDKGALLPRMTKEQCKAIVNPANGLIVYVTDALDFGRFKKVKKKHVWFPEYHGRLCVYDGKHWVVMKANILN